MAELLNGTAAQFNVYWDGKYAVIETGKPYNGTATPTALRNTSDVRKSSTSFKLDGALITFENVYLIDGDTNYLQLREFADKLKGTASQFSVLGYCYKSGSHCPRERVYKYQNRTNRASSRN